MFSTKISLVICLLVQILQPVGCAPVVESSMASDGTASPRKSSSSAEHMFGPVLLACSLMLCMSALIVCFCSDAFVANAERLIKVWKEYEAKRDVCACRRDREVKQGVKARFLAVFKGSVAARHSVDAHVDVDVEAPPVPPKTRASEPAHTSRDGVVRAGNGNNGNGNGNTGNDTVNGNSETDDEDDDAQEEQAFIVGHSEQDDELTDDATVDAPRPSPLVEDTVYGQLSQGASPLVRLTRQLSSRFGNFALTALTTQASKFSLRSIQEVAEDEDPEADTTVGYETAADQSHFYGDVAMVPLGADSSSSSSSSSSSPSAPSVWMPGEVVKGKPQYCSSPLCGPVSLSASSPSSLSGSSSSSSSSRSRSQSPPSSSPAPSPSPSPLKQMTERLMRGTGWMDASPPSDTLTARPPPRLRGPRPQPYPYRERPPPVPPKDVVGPRRPLPSRSSRALSQRDHDEALERAAQRAWARQARAVSW